MNILSWNIQAAKGVDEVTSVERIASVIHDIGAAEVICCQEVLQEFKPDGSVLIDQAAELASYFPEHTLHFGAAIDRRIDGKQVRFGNLVLSSLPVLSVAMHRLPQPAHKGSACMARQAIELVVEAAEDGRPVRILSTHLEFFAHQQRKAQASYLRSTCRDATDRVINPAKPSAENAGIYTVAPETLETILCGDLNLTLDSSEYEELNGGAKRVLHDAWTELYPNKTHSPTCGIFDHEQWKNGAHCRDYFFVTPALVPKLKELSVNTETAASDHQPLRLSIS